MPKHLPERLRRPTWEETRLCAGCGRTRIGGLGCPDCGTEGTVEGRALIVPPNSERVPMNVSPEARTALRDLLYGPAYEGSGVGYSEFILGAVERASREQQS